MSNRTPKRKDRPKKNSRSTAMKRSWSRRKAGTLDGDAKGLSRESFSRFLVRGPLDADGDVQ